MIFTKIEVENFGVFGGRHTFDLNPEKSGYAKPLILFGGKNGSGKTTLFEAFRLCLYGNNFQGKRISKPIYHKYLRQHIHQSLEDRPTTASVSVEFDYAQAGRVDRYLVKRSWTYENKQINESLEIYQNCSLLRDVNEEQWQDFLIELIPFGVSNLFFFEGEQIQNLAEETDNRYLVSSIHSLLGLDLVERLQTDLRIYLLRKAKEQDKKIETELHGYEIEQKKLKKQLEIVLQKRARVQSQIEHVESEIDDQEHQIANEGGWFASKREELKTLRNRLDEEIEDKKGKIRDLCSELLPFSLVPYLCINLRNRLLDEEKREQKKAALVSLDSVLETSIEELRNESFWDEHKISPSERESLTDKIYKTLRQRITLRDENVPEIIHHLSSKERSKTLDWIDQALSSVPPNLRLLTADLEKLVRQRQDVDKSLFRAPHDDVLHPLIQKLGDLHKQLGVLQENYRNLGEDLHKDQFELSQVISQIEKRLEQKAQLQRRSRSLELARKVQTILREYVDRLRRDKTDNLCDVFLECFGQLSNKEHLIEKMEIDPNSFSITLWDRNGAVPKSQLSAGEKQIFAFSMLWALARTSGRQLPFIIDSPFGRLDTEHREKTVQSFFTRASQQIVVFSTDTEIDQQHFNELQPYISKSYHLVYDEKAGTTRASVGYFWKGKKEEVIVGEL